MSLQAPTTPKERDVPFLLFISSQRRLLSLLPPAASAPRLSPAPRHPVGRSACPAERSTVVDDQARSYVPGGRSGRQLKPAIRLSTGTSADQWAVVASVVGCRRGSSAWRIRWPSGLYRRSEILYSVVNPGSICHCRTPRRERSGESSGRDGSCAWPWPRAIP